MSRPLQLNDLPPELLGKIFGHLAVSDILGLKAVNRAFRDVVSDQPHLQYRCELAAAGLLDNPDAPETLFKRRTNLRKYRSRFDDLRPVGRSSLSLGMTGFCRGCKNFGDVHVTHATVTDRLHFCRPPSASGSRPVKTWSVPLPFEPERFAIHPPSDLVVTADNMWARLYLMTMTTGEPHPLAANRWIKHDLWPVPMHVPHTGLAVSVSDHILSAEIRGRLIAWNWRTGAKLFDRRDLHADLMGFIGDDRLLVVEQSGSADAEEVPNLVLLDTSVPAGSAAVPRDVRFVCDPRYRGMWVRVMAEEAGHSDFSGLMGQDVPFYPDPSQRLLALLFCLGRATFGRVQDICVVRSETLLRLAREAEDVVEWDAWRKFTIEPGTHIIPGADLYAKYSISGSRFVRIDTHEAEKWAKIRVYDLSHWSRQHPSTESNGSRESDERKVQCRIIDGVLELPEGIRNISHATMLQDSLILFGFESQFQGWNPLGQGTLNIWNFW